MRKSVAAAAVAGSLLTGAGAGAILFGPISAGAQSTTTTTPPADARPEGHGGRHEAVSDLSVAAKAIGISEADLKTAVQGGQSLAAVAKAHNVDPQKVIDALVADEQGELDAAVKVGDITQAQADARKANLTQRITDRVNGTFKGGPGGPGHRGGPGGPGGHHEAVSDLSVAAKASGISEADLTTAVKGGQSLAAVAKAHNVDPQKVIDALVADEQGELDAAVKAGDLTQAQADAKKAGITQRITDRVNGTFKGPKGPGHD